MNALHRTCCFLLAAACIAIPACKSDQPTSPPPQTTDSTAFPYYRAEFVASRSVNRNFGFALESSTAVLRGVDSLAVDGGTVYLNGDTLTRQSVQGQVAYSSAFGLFTPFPVRFDGSYQLFRVTGSPSFGPLVDSIRSPQKEMIVISPAAGAHVSKAKGFTIMWEPGGLDSIRISFSSDSSYAGYYATVADNGTHTVTPNGMRYIEPGNIDIDISRGTFKEGRTPDGRRYSMTILTSQYITAKLDP